MGIDEILDLTLDELPEAAPVRRSVDAALAERRFVLPPQFRKTVKDSSDGRILCLAKHDRWDCLSGFGLSRKSDFAAQLDREEALYGREFDRDLRATQLYGFAEVPFDDSGRFIMPDHLIDLGKVEDGLFFSAAGTFLHVPICRKFR